MMGHKLGIIGYGGMARWHHTNIARIDGLSVVAAYDIEEERLKAAEEQGLKAHRSLEAFLQDDSFDMVLVATPNIFHCAMTIAALEAGKHVVCEKPVTMSCAELERMMEAARKTGRVFTVHHNRRWDKDYRMVRRTIEQGKIGKPYAIESRVHGQNAVLFGWRNQKASGGGVLLDWGVHMIDQLLIMGQEPVTEVYAQMFSVISDEVEDYFKLLMRFESGLSALVEVGTFCLESGPRWVVHGEGGSILVRDWDCSGHIVTASEYAAGWKPAVVQTVAGPTRTMAPRSRDTLRFDELPNVDDISDWCDFYKNVMAAIEGREALIVTPDQVMRTMRVIECAQESSKTGQSIKTRI